MGNWKVSAIYFMMTAPLIELLVHGFSHPNWLAVSIAVSVVGLAIASVRAVQRFRRARLDAYNDNGDGDIEEAQQMARRLGTDDQSINRKMDLVMGAIDDLDEAIDAWLELPLDQRVFANHHSVAVVEARQAVVDALLKLVLPMRALSAIVNPEAAPMPDGRAMETATLHHAIDSLEAGYDRLTFEMEHPKDERGNATGRLPLNRSMPNDLPIVLKGPSEA